ncbi:MAG: hypothetical protein WC517_04300 [Patescibacteria group bacterium]
MADQEKKINKFVLAAIILILLAMAGFGYAYWIGNRAVTATYSSNLGQFKVVDLEIMDAIKKLNACGNWLSLSVGLSADRGNPFNRRAVALPTMTATSTVLCLPVTQ